MDKTNRKTSKELHVDPEGNKNNAPSTKTNPFLQI